MGVEFLGCSRAVPGARNVRVHPGSARWLVRCTGHRCYPNWRLGTVAWDLWPQLLISGIVGILIGDLALHACLRRGGPRRTQLLFALNAPITALLAYVILSEQITLRAGFGALLTLAGVFLAVLYGRRNGDEHIFKTVDGSIVAMVGFGLIAAACQAIGLIVIKPALVAGTDPLAASALRTGGSALLLTVIALWPSPHFEPATKPTGRMVVQTVLSGVMGMTIAMSLLLARISHTRKVHRGSV